MRPFPLALLSRVSLYSVARLVVTAVFALTYSEMATAMNELGHIADDLDYRPTSNWFKVIFGLTLILGIFLLWLSSLATKRESLLYVLITGGISALLFVYGNNSWSSCIASYMFVALALLGVRSFAQMLK